MTDEKIDAKRLAEAMQLAWNEYCDDTGNHPPDFKQRTKTGAPVVRGVQLFASFEEHGPFVRYTASWYEVLQGRRVTPRRREPLPAGGHSPQHITPDPQAVRIPRGPAPGAILPYLMDHTERDDLATEINRRTQA